MPRFLDLIRCAVVVSALAVGPALAGSPTPVGSWETSTGESRYKVSYCGDGQQLCAKLVWLRSDARTPDNLAYLNKYVVRGAKAVDDNKWKGTVRYQGQTLGGSLTLVSANKMTLSGCKLVVCKSMQFRRL